MDIVRDMNQMNIRRTDLNLLVVFDAVARCRSVTMAAEQLALSQPAISHALNRLRDLMGDPLFVRSGRGLVPTPRAEAMAGSIKELLETAARVLGAREFDPATTTQSFRLGASDYAMLTIIPNVVRKLRSHAPLSQIKIIAVDADLMKRMEQGELDLAFIAPTAPGGAFLSCELFQEHFIGLACERHPITRKRKGGNLLSDYLAYPHVAVSFGMRAPNAIDTKLAVAGKKRRIVMESPNFSTNAASLLGTDIIMSLPSRLASAIQVPGLVTFKLPIAVPDYPYWMMWHRRSDADLATTWLRNLVTETVSEAERSRGSPRRRNSQMR